MYIYIVYVFYICIWLSCTVDSCNVSVSRFREVTGTGQPRVDNHVDTSVRAP